MKIRGCYKAEKTPVKDENAPTGVNYRNKKPVTVNYRSYFGS